MSWSKVVQNVATLAPGIGASIGGPVGAVAGLGIKALCSFSGVEPDASDASVQVDAALSAMTPEQAVALKKADNDFIIAMNKLDVDVFQLEVEDRKSAREQHKGSWVPGVLSAVVVAGWMVLMWCLFSAQIPEGSRDIIMRALGTADAALTMCLAYWFGSSHGSQDKTEHLAAMGGKK